MPSSKATQLRALADALKKEIDDFKLQPEAIRGQIGERHLQELEKLTDAELVQYLTSVEDSRVLESYVILCERLDPATLGEICLEYLKRPGRRARLTGALGIGLCLKKTSDRKASRALAIIIRNPEEASDIRSAAYGSLELIHWGRAPSPPSATHECDKSAGELEGIDWRFVDYFLY
jgi:hypothetical protein